MKTHRFLPYVDWNAFFTVAIAWGMLIWIWAGLLCVIGSTIHAGQPVGSSIIFISTLPLYATSPWNPGGRFIGGKLVLGSVEAMQYAGIWAFCCGALLLIAAVATLRARTLKYTIAMLIFLPILSALGIFREIAGLEEFD